MRETEELAVLVAAAKRYFETRLSMGETSIVFGPGKVLRRPEGEVLPLGTARPDGLVGPDQRSPAGTTGAGGRSVSAGGVNSIAGAGGADSHVVDGRGAASGAGSAGLAGPGDVEVDRHSLAVLEKKVKKCTDCPLHKTRTQAVFGTGSGRTGLVFVGEAPGRDEDIQGAPFVGRAGQLLTRIIEAIKFNREDVYITNVIKCRPEANRDPLPHEVKLCSPYLAEQLEILKPRVLCALGRFAAEALSGVKLPMAEYRNAALSYRGIRVAATYHPAACLRNPDLKRLVWEDVQKLRDIWKNSG